MSRFNASISYATSSPILAQTNHYFIPTHGDTSAACQLLYVPPWISRASCIATVGDPPWPRYHDPTWRRASRILHFHRFLGLHYSYIYMCRRQSKSPRAGLIRALWIPTILDPYFYFSSSRPVAPSYLHGLFPSPFFPIRTRLDPDLLYERLSPRSLSRSTPEVPLNYYTYIFSYPSSPIRLIVIRSGDRVWSRSQKFRRVIAEVHESIPDVYIVAMYFEISIACVWS